MPLPKTYNPQESEPRIQAFWQEQGIYHFDPAAEAPVYSIDTPPPTVSGNLHLGHLYSYSHPDFIARFQRMNGRNVYYPMGFDDNGLPTERLVEKRLGLRAREIGRTAFIQKCLELSRDVEQEYQAIWQRLGLSIDWRYTYRTIDDHSRRLCQLSFIALYRRGLVYRREAPAIWCPECQASFAQADLNDLDRSSEFVTLAFGLPEAGSLPIATTRPELLPACVAVFVHPSDARYRHLIVEHGKEPLFATVPLFGQAVPILADPATDPQKGTGAVMCCTFGDTTDVAWWRTHGLPVIQAIDRAGCMTSAAGGYAGLPLTAARQQIKEALAEGGLILSRQPIAQSVRVHERCDTPVEYLLVQQWFLRILDFKRELLQAGAAIHWHPASLHARYQDWVDNLNWDWCLSRQRFYGPVIPAWYCQSCGETILADEDQLPVDPTEQEPAHPCPQCGGTAFTPEQDVFDTWATSALSPQIVGQAEFTLSAHDVIASEAKKSSSQDGRSHNREGRLSEANRLLPLPNKLYNQVFPYSLRPQAHDIIRTWTFYTIVQSLFHWDTLPWENVFISGWGIAGEGMGKISKSRGGGPMAPLEMIARYSADAVRYWAASTAPGKDAIISEEKIQMGARLATKLWNVARFAERFVSGNLDVMGNVGAGSSGGPHPQPAPTIHFTPADRWILSRTQKLVRRATSLLQEYDYAAAKSEIEAFFWTELTDNYLEMAKQRLYDPADPSHEAARFSLQTVLLTVLKLFAPFMPYVTEAIYLGLFGTLSVVGSFATHNTQSSASIHRQSWPVADPALEDDAAEVVGQTLVGIATAVRRFKSERNLPLGAELNWVQLAAVESDGSLLPGLREAVADLKSITRARAIVFRAAPDEKIEYTRLEGLSIYIQVE